MAFPLDEPLMMAMLFCNGYRDFYFMKYLAFYNTELISKFFIDYAELPAQI